MKWVVEPKFEFDEVKEFHEGFAAVKKNNNVFSRGCCIWESKCFYIYFFYFVL